MRAIVGFLKAAPSGDSEVQLMLKTEVSGKDTCVHGCCSSALAMRTLWHDFGLLALAVQLLGSGSVNLADTVGLMNTRAFLAHGQALLPRLTVTWGHVSGFRPMDAGRSDMHCFLAFPYVLVF